MTGKGLIDLANQLSSDVPTGDADHTNRRVRILACVQRVFNYVYNFKDWYFRYTTASLTVSAGTGNVVVPTDFTSTGKYGGVYRDVDDEPLDYVDPQYLQDVQADSNSETDLPEIYSIFGWDTTNNRPYFQIPINTSSLNFTIKYKRKTPTIVDSDTSSMLERIPSEYHDTVLLPGVLAILRFRKNDLRTPGGFVSDPEFKAGLAIMIRDLKQGRDTVGGLPSFWDDGGMR